MDTVAAATNRRIRIACRGALVSGVVFFLRYGIPDHRSPREIRRRGLAFSLTKGVRVRVQARLVLSDDVIREVDMTTFNRQLKKSWKDVLIIYTARWCAHSTRLEEIFHRMVKAGEFEELNDELLFVKIDVVLTQPEDYKHLQTVPAVKYISARYKVSCCPARLKPRPPRALPPESCTRSPVLTTLLKPDPQACRSRPVFTLCARLRLDSVD